MKTLISDQELLWKRIKRAQCAILNAKRLDKANGGRTIEEVWGERRQLNSEFNSKREDLIFEAEKLNAQPNEIPGDFMSKQEILEAIGMQEDREILIVDGMEVEVVENFDRYLTEDILIILTKRWLEEKQRTFDVELDYFYNDTFRWNVLNFQRNIIQAREFDEVNFLHNAEDKPIIYTYNTSISISDAEQWQLLFRSWQEYEERYNYRSSELEIEEMNSSRGDYIVQNKGTLYEENGNIIFEVASRIFWGFVEIMYRLRDEHPACFKQGAFLVVDKIYEYYKEDFLPGWDLTREKLESLAIKQFLYLSNEDKQIRIDLFRQISKDRKDINEVFSGGLYHIFDHFKGLRVSNKNKGDFELQQEKLLEIIRVLFFNHLIFNKKRIDKQDQVWGHEFIAEAVFDTPIKFEDDELQYKKKKWKGVFVLNLAQNIYYIDTLHIN